MHYVYVYVSSQLLKVLRMQQHVLEERLISIVDIVVLMILYLTGGLLGEMLMAVLSVMWWLIDLLSSITELTIYSGVICS